MIKSVIIEDMPDHSDLLTHFLQKNNLGVEVCSVATNIENGLKLIEKHSPELVFLDIILDYGQSGLDILKILNQNSKLSFKVIFTTAFGDKEFDDIRISSLDYLPKPVKEKELIFQINKFKQEKNNLDELEGFRNLFHNLSTSPVKNKKISIFGNNGRMSFEVADLLYCEAGNANTIFHFSKLIEDDYVHTYGKSIGKLEKEYEIFNIKRIHRSILVNLAQIKEHIGDRSIVVLHNGVELSVSESYKDTFILAYNAFILVCKV